MRTNLHTLNIVQCLAALNENLFRFLVAYYIIQHVDDQSSSSIMATTGAVFIAPFLLFSNLGGLLADKLDKTRMVRITRFFECIVLTICYLAFLSNSIYGAYCLLFTMASLSALFGPSKYGMIPEIVPKDRLVSALSVVSAFTYIGIIIGTAATSLFLELSDFHFLIVLTIALIIAMVGFVYSLKLPSLTPINPHTRITPWFVKELIISMFEMRRIENLFPAALAYGYFFFIGGFVQLNIVPFAEQALQLPDIYGGYLFLVSSIGIGIGSYLAARVSKAKAKLKLVPWIGFALTVFLILLGSFPTPVELSCFWLFCLGLFGGLYIVYTSAYVLHISPNETRGKNFGTANFLSFFFLLLSAGALYFLNTRLELSAQVSFVIVALMNGVVMLGFLSTFKSRTPAKL